MSQPPEHRSGPALDLFSTLSRDEFLSRYWQQQPYVFRGALTSGAPLVDANELAGLACEEAVESRIVQGAGVAGPWTCRQGPFPDLDYDELGPTNWTLLVQGLDQWDDTVRQLMHAFDFLPRWRLDDVMASFAPRGGGVGPHFDFYDVFLIQDSGRRRWDIGPRCDQHTRLQPHPALKLLDSFDSQACFELDAGDIIYIPAGVAHWGVSQSDDCVTLSVGFRAPSAAELLTEAVELLAQRLSHSARYTDSVDSIDVDRFHINARSADIARSLADGIDRQQMTAAVDEAFGRLVTDTRYCSFSEQIKVWTVQDVQSRIGASRVAVVHQPHCRMAYSDRQLFVNGEAFDIAADISRQLCHGAVAGPLTDEQSAILARLLNDDMIRID